MNKEYLEELLGKLSDDVEIIVIKEKKDINKIPEDILKTWERVTFKDRVLVFKRKLWKGIKVVTTIWMISLTFFPEIIPTPIQATKFISKSATELYANIDFSFPFHENLPDKPPVEFSGFNATGSVTEGATYTVPSTGLSPETFKAIT